VRSPPSCAPVGIVEEGPRQTERTCPCYKDTCYKDLHRQTMEMGTSPMEIGRPPSRWADDLHRHISIGRQRQTISMGSVDEQG
jgi:hypothetical protein